MTMLHGHFAVGSGPVTFAPWPLPGQVDLPAITAGRYELARDRLELEYLDGQRRHTVFCGGMAAEAAARFRLFRGLRIGPDWVSVEILAGDGGGPEAHGTTC